jgi:hypothetical protein
VPSASKDTKQWLHKAEIELILDTDSKAYDKDSDEKDEQDDLT